MRKMLGFKNKKKKEEEEEGIETKVFLILEISLAFPREVRLTFLLFIS
jgi:hypothetical protein